MLAVRVVAVGRIKEEFYRKAVDEYLKRLGRFLNVDIVEVRDYPDGDPNTAVRREAENISDKLKGYVVALSIDGKETDSVGLSEFIFSMPNQGISTITFVIGGSNGLHESILKRADYRLSFGKLTFPHQLMRVMLLEQIYRAAMINSNSAYHK